VAEIPPELIAAERALLARLLCAPPTVAPPRRALVLRKVSRTVERTWVSAGCSGEVVQWRLKEKPK
jgi:hypothetical protein